MASSWALLFPLCLCTEKIGLCAAGAWVLEMIKSPSFGRGHDSTNRARTQNDNILSAYVSAEIFDQAESDTAH